MISDNNTGDASKTTDRLPLPAEQTSRSDKIRFPFPFHCLRQGNPFFTIYWTDHQMIRQTAPFYLTGQKIQFSRTMQFSIPVMVKIFHSKVYS